MNNEDIQFIGLDAEGLASYAVNQPHVFEPDVQGGDRVCAVCGLLDGGVSHVKMVPVQSSAIKSIGHDGTNIHVQFNSGDGTHRFGPFDQKTFDRFLRSKSKGVFFHAAIRDKAL